MVKLMKLHFKYLSTRTNAILGIICFNVLIISFLIGSNIFSNYETRWFNQKEIAISYENLVINLSKVLLPLFSCYLFGSSFQKVNDDYKLIIIKTRLQRFKYIISKYLVISIIILAFCLFSHSCYLLFGKISIPNFTKLRLDNIIWIKIYAITIFYGLMSCAVVLYTKSSFGYIMVIIIYFTIQIVAEVVPIKFSILPFLVNNDLSINGILLISEIVIIIWINLLKYYSMDM